MRAYFLITGTVFILYYFVLALYTHRLRSTFALFWVMAGGVHLICGCAPFSAHTYHIQGWICAACWLAFAAVETRVIRAMRTRFTGDADWIIVLGAQVRGRRVTDSLKRRLDLAYTYLTEHPRAGVIVSGGQGPGEEISEARAMAAYLAALGISGNRIFEEDRSVSTRENLKFSSEFLDREKDTVGIVTNNFHIYRASVIARQEGYRKICLLPAGANPVFQPNYLMREFFAVIKVWLDGLMN